jgi:hypothetical protein
MITTFVGFILIVLRIFFFMQPSAWGTEEPKFYEFRSIGSDIHGCESAGIQHDTHRRGYEDV